MTTDVLAPGTLDPSELTETMETIQAYENWQRAEGIPVVRGFYIEDLKTLALVPWPRKGGKGVIVNLDGTGGVDDAHVVEIAPGTTTPPEHHLYEEFVFIVSGRGSTSVWYDEDSKQTFEWGPGSLFSIPLNAWYQHFNSSGSQPACYLAVTNLPTILAYFHNEDFVFNNPFQFRDRFNGEKGYFSGEGKKYKERKLETNFISDVYSLPLYNWVERGGGGSNVGFEMAQNSMGSHVSQFAQGNYKKAHRHGPGAHVIILDGVGYSLLWQEGDTERKRIDWKPGSVVVPPEDWFHEHFNTGPKPARYLALRFNGHKYQNPLSSGRMSEGAAVSVKDGGWQIDYEDEDPSIHREFEAELAKHGAVCRMKGLVPGCTGGPLTR